jgi:DNA-binding winged helix-turn-helix (wHTH) protein
LRDDLEQVSRQITTVDEAAATSPSRVHAQVFGLQERLLGSGQAIRRMPITDDQSGASALREFRFPRPEPGLYEGLWRDQARQVVQRAHDRWLLLSAQTAAAQSLPEQWSHLAALRGRQADLAGRNIDELARHFVAVAGEPAKLEPIRELPSEGRFRIQTIEVSMTTRAAMCGGRRVQLTPVEWKCLAALTAAPGRAVSREALMLVAIGANPRIDPESRAVDVHIAHVRAKLGAHVIETVVDIGYQISGQVEPINDKTQLDLRRQPLGRRSAGRGAPERDAGCRPTQRLSPPTRSR